MMQHHPAAPLVSCPEREHERRRPCCGGGYGTVTLFGQELVNVIAACAACAAAVGPWPTRDVGALDSVQIPRAPTRIINRA
jgi:hypothetical protein